MLPYHRCAPVFVGLLFLTACSRPQPPAPSAAPVSITSPVPLPVDGCTFETPLVPGVPGSPGHLLPSEVNPNGASELAALMRTMQGDLQTARAAILAGTPVSPLFDRHRKLRCSWPTDAKDRNAAFDGLAQAYLIQVRSFDAAGPQRRASFEAVLSTCRACHQASCPGPIEAIEAMRLEVSDGGGVAAPTQGANCSHTPTES